MNDSEKLQECLKAMRYAIELIRNAHFIAAWHHLRDVLKKVEKPDRFAETWRTFLTALHPELSPRQIAQWQRRIPRLSRH
jgi:hypothetical protein